MACIFGLTELPVMAEGASDEIRITEMNQVMTVQSDCEARELPDENSSPVMSYEAGSPVWVVGESADGWYKVSYQGKEGYIPKDSVTDLQLRPEGEEGESEAAPVTLTEAGLDTEMAALEAENELIVEEVERMRGEEKRSQAWKIVIAILVAGIFAAGIFSAVRPKKKKDEKTRAPEMGDGSADVALPDKDEE